MMPTTTAPDHDETYYLDMAAWAEEWDKTNLAAYYLRQALLAGGASEL
jgi:hypothetical protein